MNKHYFMMCIIILLIFQSGCSENKIHSVSIVNTGNDELRQKVWEIFTKDGSEEDAPIEIKTTKDEIGLDFYDLDNDGIKEIIAFYPFRMLCNAAGECPLIILSKKELDYVILFGIQANPHSMSILSSKTKGYHDISVITKDGKTLIWYWNGNQYEKSRS